MTKIVRNVSSALMIAAVLGAGTAHAELVDFTGIDANGGTFATGINGNDVVAVTVGALTNVNAAGSTLEANFGGAGLRQLTQNAGGTYDAGDQSAYTVTLATAEVFTLSTGSGASAADDRDILRITPTGIPAGGPDFWVVSGTANVTVTEDADHILTLQGTGPMDTFMTYNISPSAALDSFTVTHESAVAGPTFNSHSLDLDVPLAPVGATVAVPALNSLGLWLMAGLLLIAGAVGLRFRLAQRS